MKGLNGAWVEEGSKITVEVYEFFKRYFSESISNRPKFICDKFKKLSDQQPFALEAPFTESEIKEAVWSCEGSKLKHQAGRFHFLLSQETLGHGEI